LLRTKTAPPAAAKNPRFAELLPPKDQPMFATRPTAPQIRYTVLALLLSAGNAGNVIAQSAASYGGEQ
jgi:hypothetical protein